MQGRRWLSLISDVCRNTGRIVIERLYVEILLFQDTNHHSLPSNVILLQNNVQKNINDKKTTFPMFDTIQFMWIGADYWPNEEHWKWRNSYIEFDGKI